jgi:uncharacterized membrane protein YdjX (TVP38/TMEM64 family)
MTEGTSTNTNVARVVTRRRIIATILLAVGVALLVASAELHAWLVGFLPAAESIIRERPVQGASLFVLLGACSAMLAFFSSAVIVPVGVYVWGKTVSMLLLWGAWILGGVCAYTLSRFLGRPAVHALRAGPALGRYEVSLSDRTPFAFVVLFQLAVPSEIPGYVLGLARYPFWKYLSAVAIAEFPYAVATIYLGASFVERRFFMFIGVGAAMLAFGGWAAGQLHRRMSDHSNGP